MCLLMQDLDDDPEDANHLLWLGLDAITVTVHTVFIWALSLPLALACINYQQVYLTSTNIQNLLTLDVFRSNPTLILVLSMETFLKAILIIALAWIAFCELYGLGLRVYPTSSHLDYD